ncbi:MAG: ABC transporter permease [Bacteroidales bacterium]|nr:ABC transporter permease [Bacteroidales bacterium]
MNKLLLIIQREYMSLVARKSFLVITLLVPVLIVVIGAIPALISEFNSSSSVEAVTVIDETGRLSGAIPDTDGFRFIPLQGEPGKTDPQQFFSQAGDSMSALVVIPANVLDSAKVNIYSKSTANIALIKHITGCLNDTLTSVKISAMGVPGLDKMVKEAQVDVDVNSVKLADDGTESESSTTAAMLLGMALALITYMFVLTYGAMIMNSVIEEKTNRIVEVIVSSCKPFQLMLGKIIGVALVGLTQFLIWAILISVVVGGLGLGFADSTFQAIPNMISAVQSVNLVAIFSCFAIYFLGGYLLYASLFAGFGSAVDQASDASQFTSPIIIVMIVALYAGLGCMENPNGTFAMWCSMIPFTSPIVMMVRLPYDVPFWQIAVSIAALYATALSMVWLSGRIYRIGILRYGKKFTFKEILSWIRN